MKMRHAGGWVLAVLALGLCCGVGTRAEDNAPERNAAREITWPGLKRDGSVLLPNGWSLDPAGKQIPLGDFPIQIAENPNEPILAVLHAGYGEHEVITLNAKDGDIIGRVSFPETFGGLVWSADGTRLFVGGGFDDVIYRFDHKDGLLSNRSTLTYHGGDVEGRPGKVDSDEPLPRAERGAKRPQGAIAGLALSKDGKTLWAANAWAHSLTGSMRKRGDCWARFRWGTTPIRTAWSWMKGRSGFM